MQTCLARLKMKQGLELLVTHFLFIFPSSRLSKTEESKLFSNSLRSIELFRARGWARHVDNVGSINDGGIRVKKCATRNRLKLRSANKARSTRFK